MSEHDRLEYWTAISEPTTAEQVNNIVNSPEWNLLSEKDKSFFLEVQRIVTDPSYMTPPPFHGCKTQRDAARSAS